MTKCLDVNLVEPEPNQNRSDSAVWSGQVLHNIGWALVLNFLELLRSQHGLVAGFVENRTNSDRVHP